MSTGYIAGGAIGAVLVAFLIFSDEIPRQLSAWQYRQTAIAEAEPLEQQYEDAAAAELGIKTPAAREQHKQEIEDLAGEIRDINEERLPLYIRVPAGTELDLGNQKTYKAETDTTLGEVAREVEGSARRAALLQTLNDKKLKLPEQLPVGAEIALPQRNCAGPDSVLDPGRVAPGRRGRLVVFPKIVMGLRLTRTRSAERGQLFRFLAGASGSCGLSQS